MNPKWDRILADWLVLTLAIVGIIFGMFVPLLLQSHGLTVIIAEKDTLYTAAEHPKIFWSAVMLCAFFSIASVLGAVLRGIRLKQNEERA